MTQEERLLWLIRYLMEENPEYGRIRVLCRGQQERRRLLRSLMNVRPPRPVSREFLTIQDEYLREERDRKRITYLSDLDPAGERLYLWRGDITTLAVDGIVNAANSALLGCFVPCHGCIDNAIHSAAGVQLRLACHEIMESQGGEEPAGRAKITPGFNLPCRYVLHTVGPIVRDVPDGGDFEALASCYRSCLELAEEHGLLSVAFCCISTGEFHFPNGPAAETAVKTVREFLQKGDTRMEVVFNVFKETDFEIYRRLLGAF